MLQQLNSAVQLFLQDRANTAPLVAALREVGARYPRYRADIENILIPRLQPLPPQPALQGVPPPVPPVAGGGGERGGKSTRTFVPVPRAELTRPDQLIGYDQLKKFIKTKVVQPTKFPSFYPGAVKRKGFLMYGPGGTGKTAFARMVGYETELPMFIVVPSDIQDPLVGEAEKHMRTLFQTAAAAAGNKGAIIFFDEADSILGGTSQYTVGIKNEFKTQVSSPYIETKNIIIIAATNNPESITDLGIKRRLDVQIYVGLPIPEDRGNLIRFYSSKHITCSQADGLSVDDYATLIALTAAYTPDELRRLVDAAFAATRPSKDELMNLVYCNLPGGKYSATYPNPPATKDCYTIDQMSNLGAQVCWPVAKFADFQTALRVVSPTTRWRDLLNYYEHANESNDDEGRARVCVDLRQFKASPRNLQGKGDPLPQGC
jgi:SpoVK/Ycf46/Vps4 family AAA+-type ATPase